MPLVPQLPPAEIDLVWGFFMKVYFLPREQAILVELYHRSAPFARLDWQKLDVVGEQFVWDTNLHKVVVWQEGRSLVARAEFKKSRPRRRWGPKTILRW